MSRNRRCSSLCRVVVWAGAATFLFAGLVGCPPSDTTADEPVVGDLNGDRQLDQTDVDLMSAAFGAREGDPQFVAEADLTGDGVIGLDDLQELVRLMEE
jgi:hypothetical protein